MSEELSRGVDLVFPVASEETEWELTAAQVAQWQNIYPDVDVERECRKAWAWIDANPKKRKTARGMKHFLVGWLNRATPTRTVERVTEAWSCPHLDECAHRRMCEIKDLLPQKYPKKALEAAQGEFRGLLREAQSDRWR